eukprot:CAMPEP_0174902446 /NCGR_PEP_ID=MMETSP0167-20121228/37840_1 /TAXON_ID=38298 /ORGANISM="Rhodella maculata, Strain CCMP736" /LENGTH=337 /DNA_ID=CAMNT_0016144453 /DNA_START=6 /DNA_END=1019 /DNA_ORIENTATION=-
MALCAYEQEPKVIDAIRNLSFVPADLNDAWTKVALRAPPSDAPAPDSKTAPDIEDFFQVHSEACQRGETTYMDPATGYNVFTELAHKLRGKCCGSGCRHCPYSHENVKDKPSRIQQPAMMYAGDDSGPLALRHGYVRCLFDSGGKDSFLAIRAMARQAKEKPFGLVLLTTFDATSRIIAHQDISIDVVLQQAQALGIALIGVPMHRGSSEGYVSRIQRALGVIEKHVGEKVAALVFGDLHLEHIVQWRGEQLGPLGYELQYPLLRVDYGGLLDDLEKSQVVCVVSSSTVGSVSVGDVFNREFSDRVKGVGIDGFGENGEFHTVARVWKVDRSVALGL